MPLLFFNLSETLPVSLETPFLNNLVEYPWHEALTYSLMYSFKIYSFLQDPNQEKGLANINSTEIHEFRFRPRN